MAENKGFTQLKADLKAEQLQNVYIFHGEETYLPAAICSRCASC